jgi:hypothetical protein
MLQGFRAFLWGVFFLMFIATAPPVHAGEIIDRIVATVNGHIILQSDWDDAVQYEAFMDNREAASFTAADRKAALDRLIDQELLREQMRASDALKASEDDVTKRVVEIRKVYHAGDDSKWREVLAQHGVTPAELSRRVEVQIEMMRLVDERLRPTIQIDAKSIESYYQQSLLPQLRQSGANEVALADVTPRIKELLTQQKLDQLLTAWLENLRATSEIRTQLDPGDQGMLQ